MMQFARAGDEARMGRLCNAVLWSADDDALGLCGAPPKLQDGKQQGAGGRFNQRGCLRKKIWETLCGARVLGILMKVQAKR